MSPNQPRPTVRHWIEYLAARIFICIVQSMRLESCLVFAKGLAFLANNVLRLRQRVIDENLRQAFPDLAAQELAELRRQMWRHLFLMICEIAHVGRKIQRTNWREYVQLENEEAIVEFLLDERPTVVVSGHFGNFEAAGYICGLFGFPTFTVARTLDNKLLDRYVNEFRAAKGQFILPKDGSSQQVQQILDDGETLTLLGDQNAGPKGVWVSFMGRPASCHKAVALFSLSNEAPMMATHVIRRNKQPLQFVVGVGGIFDPTDEQYAGFDVRDLTSWYNERLEQAIRQAPEQYWWVHRRWKGEPSPRQRRQMERSRTKARPHKEAA